MKLKKRCAYCGNVFFSNETTCIYCLNNRVEASKETVEIETLKETIRQKNELIRQLKLLVENLEKDQENRKFGL